MKVRESIRTCLSWRAFLGTFGALLLASCHTALYQSPPIPTPLFTHAGEDYALGIYNTNGSFGIQAARSFTDHWFGAGTLVTHPLIPGGWVRHNEFSKINLWELMGGYYTGFGTSGRFSFSVGAGTGSMLARIDETNYSPAFSSFPGSTIDTMLRDESDTFTDLFVQGSLGWQWHYASFGFFFRQSNFINRTSSNVLTHAGIALAGGDSTVSYRRVEQGPLTPRSSAFSLGIFNTFGSGPLRFYQQWCTAANTSDEFLSVSSFTVTLGVMYDF